MIISLILSHANNLLEEFALDLFAILGQRGHELLEFIQCNRKTIYISTNEIA